MAVDLLILGASARGAAFSALRIGLRPACGDLFADADLASTCPVHRVEAADYPEGLMDIAGALPPMPWLYTGALENQANLVDRILARHRLLGNPGATLRAVRDPIALAESFRDAGLVVPGVRLDPSGLPVDGSWLRKPLASAGGRSIHPWLGGESKSRRPSYYQERVDGLPLAAIFVGDGQLSRCLGLSRQLLGHIGQRFAYRGSLAPWPVSAEVRSRVERLGEAVAARFGLVGLFGIDLIVQDGQPWPVELNPRYTASVEVLEWALGRSLLAEHLQACGWVTSQDCRWTRPESFAAKVILQAEREFRWPSDWAIGAIDPAEFPEIADIPHPGTTFRPGEPVLTVFARGHSPGGCWRALAARVLEWRRRIRSLAVD
jgi:predicted ATP-grasp superfamily ATP-dependent carboligase